MSKGRNIRPRLELQSTLVRDDMPFQVVPGLFIGSIYASLNEEGLRQHGITHILNASRCPSTFPNSFTYLAIDIRDNGAANILSCIPVSNIFIESGMDHGGVLVHCYGGRSRSAALIAAFLMSSMNLNYDEVLPFIVQARPMTAINGGFQQSLRAYGSSGYDVYRAQQVLLKHRLKVLRELRESNLKRILLDNDTKLTSDTEQDTDREMKICDRNKRDRSPRPDSASSNSINSAVSNNSSINNYGIDTYMDIENDAREAATSILRGMSNDHNCNVLPDERERSNNHTTTSSTNDSSSSSISSNNGFPVPPRPSQLLSMRSPPLRLSRPSSTSIRVIPPLRGLDRQYCCSWPGCGTKLFCLVNVVRTDDFENNSTNDNNSNTNNNTNNYNMERFSTEGVDSHSLSLSLSAESKNSISDSSISSNNNSSGSKMHLRDTNREAMEKRLVQMDLEDGVFHDDGTSISTSNGPNSFSDTDSLISPPGSSGNSNHLLSPTMGVGMGMYNMNMGTSTGCNMHVAPPVTSRAAGAKKFSFDNYESTGNNSNSNSYNDSKADEKGRDDKYEEDDTTTTATTTTTTTTTTKTTSTTSSIEEGAKEGNNKFRVPGVPLGMKVNLPYANTTSATVEAKLSAFESPRIPIPPSSHSHNGIMIPALNTHSTSNNSASLVGNSRRQWSPGRTRPQSAERRRWMARMSLLQQGHTTATNSSNNNNNNNISNRGDKAEAKVLEVMQGDELALAGGLGRSKYVHLEWLPWMGDDIPSGTCDEGDIKCPGCDRVLGSWAWNPHPRHTMNGRLDVPLIRVLRSVVCAAGLELDATPLTTPRTPRDELSGTCNSSSNTPRSARSRPSSSTTPTRMSESK